MYERRTKVPSLETCLGNPYGNSNRVGVRRGNVLLCRCMLLAILASVRRCYWFLENPGSSLLPRMPESKYVMAWADSILKHYQIYWCRSEVPEMMRLVCKTKWSPPQIARSAFSCLNANLLRNEIQDPTQVL